MYKFERLDVNIVYACNLSCKGCISLSNFDRKGLVKLSELTESFEYWSKLISPEIITLFGGEPTLHKDLLKICRLIRYYWSDATIRLITNGYLLNKFEPSAWFELGNFELQVSIHRKDHESIINKNITEILHCKKDWKVKKVNKLSQHEQINWTHKNFKLYKSIFKDFVEPFKFVDGKISPHNSNPQQAHAICGSPSTPVLYKNKLYKCPVVANIMDITGENWYNYKPCVGADDLPKFISGINIPETVCGGCPSNDSAVIIDHFDKENVIVKHFD